MKKILVANRGEIALRIMRTCREMGIATVAVYSEADRAAPFVRYADEAYFLGPAPSSQSYLNMDKIVAAARHHGADGIHPGYGFLSENPAFARRLEQEGITLIGPPATAMEMMGNKLAAKATAKAHQVPLVPGSEGAVATAVEALALADSVGFPMLIKAAAGGGGKGMRLVQQRDELEEQLTLAMSEAKSAFGDSSVFLERFVTKPRHIEVQVLADKHGHAVHLFERECSIQRRHQKVVEEAPSSVLTPTLRSEMGECAVRLALACGYVGAGTVEFLLDAEHRFYFLEMNTRLQVEHPVTELITGVDLVRQQILVAMGQPLAFEQKDLTIKGHAIEVRVYAEDPENGFLPDIGKLTTYRRPQGPGVRVDDGYEEGMTIPIYYDPMLAKLIGFADTRDEAIARATRAIEEYNIQGVKTTLPFCRFAINHPAFTSGDFDTNFVQAHFQPSLLAQNTQHLRAVAAAFVATNRGNTTPVATEAGQSERAATSRWQQNRKR